MTPRLRREAVLFVTALRFLTRLPLPPRPAATAARLAASPRWYPAVGLVVGGLGALVLLGAAPLVGPVVAALLATAATVAVTGAMHEDGLGDACDGLGGATPERALAIMRDSRVGTFGLLGLGLTVAVKVACLAALPEAVAVAALVAGHAGSRLACVASITTAGYARPGGEAGGTAGFTARGIGRPALAVAAGTASLALAGFAAVAGIGAALAAAGGLAAGGYTVRRVFERRLGGYTGDTLGACQQLAEAGCYLAVLAWL